jgi:hypothetical protein
MTNLLSENFIERKIKRSIPHPEFIPDPKHINNDIGLLQMEISVNFQWNIIPICLTEYQDGGEILKLPILTGLFLI